MDLNRVIGEVAARHGVRLDPDDPALVLVTVAEMMLQEAQEEFLASASKATAEFVEAAGRAQAQAGAAVADRDPADMGKSATQYSSIEPLDAEGISGRHFVWGRWGMPWLLGILLFVAGLLLGTRLAL